MKNLMLVFKMMFATLVASSSTAIASSGKAYLSGWFHYDSTNSIYYLSVSNVTDVRVSVEITLFDADGSMITGSHFYNEPNTLGISTTGADALTLSPRTSKIIHLSGLNSHGWGIIEWTQAASTSHALVACSWVKSTEGDMPITVNDGKPF